jgi:serine/threonine-protein kinase
MAASKHRDSDTAVNPANPFDSTDGRGQAAAPREMQQSDPPTVLVRRGSFHELLPGSVVDDTYEIDARLGGGAMGDVYAARHLKLGKRVAIKVIGKRLSDDAEAIERFAMEARTLAQIQHPTIVAIDHVGELADGRAYFVMELLRGESLFERLQRGRLPLPEAIRVLDQMARGLDAAHAQGIIHRDLKPENTFLVHLPDEPPIVKLVDFGLAKLGAERADVDRRAERTQSGVAIGTPLYMSPEQARGPNVDLRTDIYALGCVAYDLILGVAPFPHAQTLPAIYAAHLHEIPTPPRMIWEDIAPELDMVLFAMLAKDPAYRPTLAQFRSVLANLNTIRPSRRAETQFVRAVPASMGWGKMFAYGSIALALLVIGIVIGSMKHAAVPTPITKPAPIVTPAVVPAPPTPAAPVIPLLQTSIAARHVEPAPKKQLPRAKRVQPAPTPAATPATAQNVPPAAPPPINRDQTINPFEN